MEVIVIIPTCNAGDEWSDTLKALVGQKCNCEKLIVDSSSIDSTAVLARKFGLPTSIIDKSEFNHGGTRQRAIHDAGAYDVVVFLTQDAILQDEESLTKIIRYFEDDNVAAVCGRQLPRKSAKPIEVHARTYNYSSKPAVRSMKDAIFYGLKTAFISNSFAAYRVSALNEVGGFPDDVIFGEDMYVATKMLMAGYKIAYAADARVYHSHDYSLWQEMKRYFDMGVFHARELWIRQELGGAEGEGLKFVVSELKYLYKNAFWRIPESIIRTLFRYAGFRLGLIEKRLPLWLKKKLAMNKGYFESL